MAKFKPPLPVPRSGHTPLHHPPAPLLRTQHSLTCVSELSCRLQEAIQNGDEDLAAETAAQMARQRAPVCVQCSPQKHPSETSVRVKVHIEDSEERAGHVILSVQSVMSVKLLKNKMFQCFGFPPEVQCWIIGSSLAKDSELLCDLTELSQDSSLFLYLTSAHAAGLTNRSFQENRWEEESPDDGRSNLRTTQNDTPHTNSPHQQSPLHQSDYQTHIPLPNEQGLNPRLVHHRLQSPGVHDPPVQGLWLSPKEKVHWTCRRCTFAENKSSSQNCEICELEKPSAFSFTH